MSRFWGPHFKAIQEAIVALVGTERAAQNANLPTAMQLAAGNFFFGVSDNPERTPDKAFVGLVLPPENSAFTAEVTNSLESDAVEFRIVVATNGKDSDSILTYHREFIGLVMDALQSDMALAGLVSGPAAPFLRFYDLQVGEGAVRQEVGVRYITRNDGL